MRLKVNSQCKVTLSHMFQVPAMGPALSRSSSVLSDGYSMLHAAYLHPAAHPYLHKAEPFFLTPGTCLLARVVWGESPWYCGLKQVCCIIPAPDDMNMQEQWNDYFGRGKPAVVPLRGCIQKFPDWVDNEINNNNNKHSLRSNIKGYGDKTHWTDPQNSDTTALSGRELYHLQFSLRAASPETFRYTLYVYHKSQLQCPGINPGPPRWEAGN
jgi:hypothetical protein